jgi:hypothetical protein
MGLPFVETILEGSVSILEWRLSLQAAGKSRGQCFPLAVFAPNVDGNRTLFASCPEEIPERKETKPN